MNNHTDALRKLRNCPPRLSKTPDPEEPWPEGYERPEGYETPVISHEEWVERSKFRAKEAYDTLIQMGGRPTRSIQFNPRWKTVLFGGEHCYEKVEQDETLFYYRTAKPSRRGRSWTEAGFISGQWGAECEQFEEELQRWRDFRDSQQWIREHRPNKAREEDMERQRYPQDPHLTASLSKLKDWKEYQTYFQRGIDRCKKIIEGARRAVEVIERKDPEVEEKTHKGHGHQDWLRIIERKREWLAAEDKRLEWVKQQLPAVLSECAASLMGAPTSRREMEERSELEAKGVFNALVETGGRPTRPMRPVPDIQDREHTDEHLHILCHWEGECSQFEEELREWKKFLDYQQKKEADRRMEVQLEEQQPAETTQVKLWQDYRAYQRLEVDTARQWAEFWQRQVEYFQENENCCALQGLEDEAYRHHSETEDARSYVEEARKQVRPVQMRLEWVEEQLSALLAERAVSTTEVSTSNHLEDQAKLPKRAPRSGQTTLKDLRSHRSKKSAPQSNHEKEKNRASANSTLSSIRSSRVSKATEKKAPRCRRQSKILAEHGNGQNQGPNTTTSPLLPANVALRRSSRLSNNEKSAGALKSNLAVGLGQSTRSLPSIPRRSDRISKQKERTNRSTTIAVVNFAVILEIDPLRRLSRSKSKGRHKSDSSSVKPRGILKRQGSNFERNRTKIHN